MKSSLWLGVLMLAAATPAVGGTSAPQAHLDRFAHDLGFTLTYLDNSVLEGCPPPPPPLTPPEPDAPPPLPPRCFSATLTLKIPAVLPDGDWSLYTGFTEKMEPPHSDLFTFVHVNGDLYRLSPKPGVHLEPGQAYTLPLLGSGHMFSAYFALPNAYVTAPGLVPAVVAATQPRIDPDSGLETLPWVTPLRDEVHLARQDVTDETVWLTPERLYQRNAARDRAVAAPDIIVLPTPQSATHLPGARLDLSKGIRLALTGVDRAPVADALAELAHAGIRETAGGAPLAITLDRALGTSGAYRLRAEAGKVTIAAADAAGASYALRSLVQQAVFERNQLRPLDIEDQPAFAFRGMFLDIARNFQTKDTIVALLEQMARYKLNVLHLHLGDDEGWRLDIDGLPELTAIGSRRCADETETTCLQPQLGAGPTADGPVNGFLSRQDYIDILKAAQARQIEVIPSFDMPGHSRAAIVAMRARAQHLIAAGQPQEAARYRLDEPGDKSVFDSNQHYDDNTLNVCLPATYAFIDKVMSELQALHAEAGVPLDIYHIGTDETAGAWRASPACKTLMADTHMTPADLGPMFIERVSGLLARRGITPAGWSDGMGHTDPARMPAKVQANSWAGLFSGGVVDTHRLINRGWSVVMSTPEVLYLDMPVAPDPEERGYDWASRDTDLYKVFVFMPDNLPANAAVMTDIHSRGATLDDTVPIRPGYAIAGLQGQLWSETVRSRAIADYMTFPRLLAVAERAWHRAAWAPAYVPGKSFSFGDISIDRVALLDDWSGFKAKVAAQFPALDAAGVAYRVPPPGGRIVGGRLYANSELPSLAIEYRIVGGKWRRYVSPVRVSGPVDLRTTMTISGRTSRVEHVVASQQ